VNKQQIELSDFARTLIDELRGDLNGREVEFIVGDLGPVDVDAALMRQVLANLFGNALKFTRTQNRAVIEFNRIDRAGERVFYVKDNGVGYDPQYAEKLFGVFQRLHSMREFEGTGVGLAIVHRVITRHGGRVWSESTLGRGATFYFTLPHGDPVTT
jgi:light-regulated signal transduction histidine kinase (bacteriophytochrome)